MGKGANADGKSRLVANNNEENNKDDSLAIYSWDEVKKHTSRDNCWIVIEGFVYDVTRWQKKHPGGAKIIGHYGGQDATDAFTAMHPDMAYVKKFMTAIRIGRLEEPEVPSRNERMMEDFRALRGKAESRGLFKASPLFFSLHFLHIILLEVAAYFLLLHLDGGVAAFFLTGAILATAQAQAGWTQHDYGHLSVFPSTKVNHIFHHITIGVMKAAGSHWWNFRHFQHHVKPNVFKKDPDITLPYVFMLGDKIAKKWGENKRGKLPFQHQHNYFWILGPMGLLTVFTHLENIYFVLKRREWVAFTMTMIFFARFDYMYAGFYGSRWMSLALYMYMRLIESFWFTFVTQMSHLPMEIDEEKNNNWLQQQTTATCNIETSTFNDWFSGHLNFQIEHHLFPTMPRHNLHKVADDVRVLCKKYNQPYIVKPLFTAFGDIIRSLKKTGNIWHEAYHHL